jgi:hypothetical protein
MRANAGVATVYSHCLSAIWGLLLARAAQAQCSGVIPSASQLVTATAASRGGRAGGGQTASPQAQRPALFVIDHGMATMTDGVARGSSVIAPDLTEVASRLASRGAR